LADANKTYREEYSTIFLAKSANNFFFLIRFVFETFLKVTVILDRSAFLRKEIFSFFAVFFLLCYLKKIVSEKMSKIKSLIGQHIQFFARQNFSRACAKKKIFFSFLPPSNEDIHVTVMTNLKRKIIVHSSK
jgi:hypothetical protein